MIRKNLGKRLIMQSFIMMFALGAILFLSGKPVWAQASGPVSLTPNFLIFEGRQRSAEVSILNNSEDKQTYRIHFGNYRISDEGHMVHTKESKAGDMFADKFIRYSPRRATLEGRRAQTIRVMVRKPRNLPDGEYRTHLFVTNIPKPDQGSDIAQLSSDLKDGQLGMNFRTLFSLSIPVIIRHGKLDAKIALRDPGLMRPKKGQKDDEGVELDPNMQYFTAKMLRKGNRSVFGRMEIAYKSASGGAPVVLADANVRAYNPNDFVLIRIPLKVPDNVKLNRGTLVAKFTENGQERPLTAMAKLNIP